MTLNFKKKVKGFITYIFKSNESFKMSIKT